MGEKVFLTSCNKPLTSVRMYQDFDTRSKKSAAKMGKFMA